MARDIRCVLVIQIISSFFVNVVALDLPGGIIARSWSERLVGNGFISLLPLTVLEGFLSPFRKKPTTQALAENTTIQDQ